MEEKFDQIKYQNEFNKQKYDRISVMFPKGEKEIIKAAADQAGKSVNAYILEAVHEKMERGN
jgi:uncharacterized protein (DUF1778 family)